MLNVARFVRTCEAFVTGLCISGSGTLFLYFERISEIFLGNILLHKINIFF
jgi:hypothetical protein